MNVPSNQTWSWIWPSVGATPIHQGLDSEMFDRTDYPYSETFVREAIQNSLDARLDPSKPVVVNFTFHSDRVGPRRPFLEQVMNHRNKAGLEIPEDWANRNVRWLVVEDFNSKGLGGSLGSRVSDFWNYWLNFGLSNKDGSGRGGRGIGRVTFLIASRVQSVIGYTRRAADGSTAVCGMAVLRAREDGRDLKSTHAYLAKAEDGNIYALHDSAEFQDSIRSAFSFTGYSGAHQSGLGLAILYPHDELEAGTILAAAIENFAPAIMKGSLVLKVNSTVLDASTLDDIAFSVAHRLKDPAIKSDVARYLKLVRLAQTEASPHSIKLPAADRSDFEPLRKSTAVKALQQKILNEQDVVLEIVFPLSRKGTTRDVALRAAIGPAGSGKAPIDRLFREGMSLPDVRAKSPGELDLVMLVGEGELATYLNFCEGKAHLDLLESKEVSQKLKERGFDGPRVKRLVKSLPRELRLLLTPDTTTPDAQVFDSYFSKPSDRPGKRKGLDKPSDPPEPPPPQAPAFRVETLDDGLRIKANSGYLDWPVNLTVTLAYADGTRRPSWSPFDFKLEDLNINHTDCQLKTDKNRVKALDCGPKTVIEITGFDRNRELDTNIRPWKNA